MFKNALVSTSNKNGLADFLRPFAKAGMRIVSTGGTANSLEKSGLKIEQVAQQTGFPEVMDGRVRTLHPRIHMALLARAGSSEDQNLLQEQELDPFDLVVVNLYPFADAVHGGKQGEDLIDEIDIGGPALLRAAAKNHSRITVVCDPADYDWIGERISQGGTITLTERQTLAAKVFSHTSSYDALIAKTLDPIGASQFHFLGSSPQTLRYGENPQQSAHWLSFSEQNGLHQAELVHGKALSFNNLLDLSAAVTTMQMFSQACAVAVKHNNPCGVGTGERITEALHAALAADPVSVFGGIIAVNRMLAKEDAEALKSIFLECVLAPGFTAEALEILKKKKDLRLLVWPECAKALKQLEFRSIVGGYLVQDGDRVDDWSQAWKVVGREPTEQNRHDLEMAWKVCAALKSNAIAIVQDGKTIGLGMGQVNRVDSVRHAIERMHQFSHPHDAAVLASDAFFPFADSIELIAQAGIKWVIQPGGSIRDDEVLKKAAECDVNVILTGKRHFRH